MTPQEKLDAAIKDNNINLLREAISEDRKIIDDRTKGIGTYDSSSPSKNSTIYKAIEACVDVNFFKVLLENGAHIPEYSPAYIYGKNYIYDRFKDALFYAVHLNGSLRDKEKKNNNEQVINSIIEELSPQHSKEILSEKFGILYQALENTACSANVIDTLFRKGAVVNNEHDGSLDQLFHNRRETDQEMAKIASKILDNGGIIYQDSQYPDSHSINRAVDSYRRVGAETMKVLLAHGATVSEYTIEQVLNPRNYQKDVAELLVDNFTPPNPQVFLDQALRIGSGGQKSIDFVITRIFDPNLLEPHHPRKQEMLNRLEEIHKEIDSKNHQQIKEIAQHSNAIGSVSGFSSDSVENIPGYDPDKNFAKITGIEGIENKVEDMTNSYGNELQKRLTKNPEFNKMLEEQLSRKAKREDAVKKSILETHNDSDDEYGGIEIEEVKILLDDEEIPNDKPTTTSASLVSQNSNQQQTRK